MDILKLIGRDQELFVEDMRFREEELLKIIRSSRFLVVGGAGSIGQATVLEIFKRQPKVLHVVDLSENNLVELVRDIRSSLGYIPGEFKTFAIDCGGIEFEVLMNSNPYDYLLNFSALKHVRSEKDPLTLMRMIDVNILNTEKMLDLAIQNGLKKFFCVSTDKASNPVSMMGASKRIMELCLMDKSRDIGISTARFANVAFSDGSLLHGFNQRLQKAQPFSAPNDVKRYFITPKEAGELCILSCIFGENRDIFFPKLSPKLHMITFSEIAVNYLEMLGFTPHVCASEDEARSKARELIAEKKYACYFFESDTTGEKDFEEFYTEKEVLDMHRFKSIGVIANQVQPEDSFIKGFRRKIQTLKDSRRWTRGDLVDLFIEALPEFSHLEKGKFLDEKM
jgi:FlaA1/EpsC-like NDP-sugar epimerase